MYNVFGDKFMKKVDAIIGISGRHVHLSIDTYKKLFDEDLHVRNALRQPGQFAAEEVVSIKTEKNEFKNVHIIGPLRDYDQVEISQSDARKLGIKPPIRKSGELQDASKIIVSTKKGEVTIYGCIIANRHVHMNFDEAKELGVCDGDKMVLELDGEKSGSVDVYAKVSKDAVLEVHLDTDDANAFLLSTGDVKKLSI